MDTAREWGPYPRSALKYLRPSHKLLAASSQSAHIFTATQTKRDQEEVGSQVASLTQRCLLLPHPCTRSEMVQCPPHPHPRSLPTPARPRRPRRSSSLGRGEDAAGRRKAGVPGRPHLPPSLTPPAATGPSLFPCPPTPCAFGVRICATCRQPQPGALFTLPLTALSSRGLLLVPRHLAVAGRARDAPASYPGL